MPLAIAPLSSEAIIAELGFTPADDGSAVHLTGNETIAGIKTFSTPIADGSIASAAVWNAKQAALGFTPENVANKATNFATVNDTLYPSVAAVKAYADALVVGLVDDRGNFDASANTFPSSGGSGSAGAILKGDLWIISVAGTLGGVAVAVGDQVRALVDTPGQTASNWAISEANIGYVPENVANKATSFSTLNNTLYPTTQAVADYLAAFVGSANITSLGTVTSGGLGAGAVLGGVTMTLGSDADGDIYYRSSNVLTRLPKGTAGHVLTMNAGATAPEWAAAGSSGANAALSNLASVAINTALVTGAGIAAAFTATAPAAANGASQVGVAVNLTASNAVASLDTAGAAVGGAINLTTGNAARNTSGNANGGNLNIILGTGIGTGTQGQVVLPVTTAANPPTVVFSGSTSTGFLSQRVNTWEVTAGASSVCRFGGSALHGIIMARDLEIAWYGTAGSFGTSLLTPDVGLVRVGAGALRINDGFAAANYGRLEVGTRDTSTAAVTNGLTIGHQLSSGTPATGMGSAIQFNINTNLAERNAGQIAALWANATDGSQSVDFVFYATHLGAAQAEAFRIKSNGFFTDAGIKRVSTQFDKTNDTLANVTGLSLNVAAGRTYTFRAVLHTTSDVSAGVKVAIAGTATATAIVYEARTINAGAITQGRATALGTGVGGVTAVTAAMIIIEGTITVNAAGTLTVQFAQNATNAAASSVLVGSSFMARDNP
jgi:hypothetical protein